MWTSRYVILVPESENEALRKAIAYTFPANPSLGVSQKGLSARQRPHRDWGLCDLSLLDSGVGGQRNCQALVVPSKAGEQSRAFCWNTPTDTHSRFGAFGCGRLRDRAARIGASSRCYSVRLWSDPPV